MKERKGITLIALVITIVILLILAGVAILALTNTNLFAKAKEAKQSQIEAEMQESLQLAIQELQIEKLGGATLDDITQEWLDEKMKDYESTLEDDPEIEGKEVILEKDGITRTFVIDENLNIIKIENKGSLIFKYEVGERDGEKVKIIIKVQDKEKGINQIDIPDKNTVVGNGTKEQIEIEYEVQIGTEYKITIMLGNGELKDETILINEYYHKVTKNLAEEIKIDNTAIKTAYNKPYQATLTTEGEYAIDALTVTMGGEAVTVDAATGVINIEKVTGDIEITATSRKLEITVTAPIIAATTTATSSVADNSQTRGTTLYIKFSAKLEGTACTIVNKEDNNSVPYAITKNGLYTFIATGTYNGKIITKEIEVAVNKYQAATGLVQYDAGDWTEDEINDLKNLSLYNINTSKEASTTVGLNFTFGGFTYKGDTTNENYINDGTVITSRNQSVASQGGTPKYEGWQILESNEQDGKTYVTKLVHAGSPENFVLRYSASTTAYHAEYILSSGERQTSYNTYKARHWEMYKDKNLNEKGYIKEVHAMTYDEAFAIVGSTIDGSGSIRDIDAKYWLAARSTSSQMRYVCEIGTIKYIEAKSCWGIRPVVELNDGVYVVSGSGTEADPYILGKD